MFTSIHWINIVGSIFNFVKIRFKNIFWNNIDIKINYQLNKRGDENSIFSFFNFENGVLTKVLYCILQIYNLFRKLIFNKIHIFIYYLIHSLHVNMYKIFYKFRSNNYVFFFSITILSEHNFNENYVTDYISILTNMIYLTILLSLVFALLNYIFSFFLFFLKSDYNKTAYECGFEPFDESMRHPFDIHFYIVGILFLVFDLEISCLIPAAFNLGTGWININIVAIFLIIVTLGFILEYNIGALDWFFLKLVPDSRNITYASMYITLINYNDEKLHLLFWDYLLTIDMYINLNSLYLLYLFLIFVYILLNIIEISFWHYNKSRYVTNSEKYFFCKLEKRLKIIAIITSILSIVYYIFTPTTSYQFFDNMIVLDSLVFKFQVIIVYLTLLSFYKLKNTFMHQKDSFLLIPVFFLSNLFFLSLLLVANHIIILIISIIGINLGLYILLFIDTKKTRLESGLKYFFLSVLVVSLLYISILLLYTFTYNTNFDIISYKLSNFIFFDQKLLGLLFIFTMFIFFFKAGIFPSNFFLPEIYKGLSSFLFTYISLPLKATFFAFIIKFFNLLILNNQYTWFVYLLYIIIIFSFIIGPIGAITSTDLYSFFAYISVTQLGWLLMGLLATQNLNAVLFYYFYYFLISSILVYLFADNNIKSINNNSISNFITEGRNLQFEMLLIFTLITLTGLPPAAAFIPKLYILISSFNEGYWLIVLIAIISSVFSGYYYIRLVYLLVLKLNKKNLKNLFIKNLYLLNNNFIYLLLWVILLSIYIIALFYWPYIYN